MNKNGLKCPGVGNIWCPQNERINISNIATKYQLCHKTDNTFLKFISYQLD